MSEEANPSAAGSHEKAKAPKSRRRGQRGGRTRSSRNERSATFGAVDLGTNNCRLLIAKETPSGYKVIDSYSRVVRLGAGLSATGALSQKAMDAAVEAIGVCADKMKAKRVKRWRCIATQACRQASNGQEFLNRIKKETGISFELISPRVEARLAVMGCLSLIDTDKDVALVIDIGGGSSELSWVDVRKLRKMGGTPERVHRPPISAWVSLPVGVVTLSEAMPSDDESPEALAARYEKMKDHVRNLIVASGSETRFTNMFEEGRGHLIGTSGTITSLAGIHLNLPFYQRDKVDGLWMRTEHATAIARRLSSMTIKQRANVPSISEDRATLLIAGCAIMDVIMEMWPAEQIRVADRGLREGMLIGLMNTSQRAPDKPKRKRGKKKHRSPEAKSGGDNDQEK